MTTKEQHSAYNRSEKGSARYARYRSRHWDRVEAARLAWHATRQQRRLDELHAKN